MTLKVELKPGERIIVGTAVIRNGATRARFHIEGEAPILREEDILTPATADSPAKKIYLAVQLMYLTGDLAAHHEFYFPLVQDFLKGGRARCRSSPTSTTGSLPATSTRLSRPSGHSSRTNRS